MKTREKHRVARRVKSDRPFTWDAGQRFIARSASLFFHPCVRTADHSPQSFFTWTNKRQRHEGQRTFPLNYLSTRICPSLTSVQECPSLFPNLSHRESFVPGYRATNWHLAAFDSIQRNGNGKRSKHDWEYYRRREERNTRYSLIDEQWMTANIVETRREGRNTYFCLQRIH